MTLRELLEDLDRITQQVSRSHGFQKNLHRRARRRLGFGMEKKLRSRKVRKRKNKRRLEQGRAKRKLDALGYEGRRLGPK